MSFRFRFFCFVSVFLIFFVSVSVFVNGIKIFLLTDIFVSVNVNHTANNGIAIAVRNGHDKTTQGENVIWIQRLMDNLPSILDV